MNKKSIIVLSAIVVVLAGGAFVYVGSTKHKDDTDKTTAANTSTQPNTTTPGEMQMPAEDNSSKTNNSGDNAQASTTNQVTISNYAFSPATITVKAGTKVTWTNQDSVQHTVTMDDSDAAGPKSELLSKGDSYSYTFTKAGTYEYHCTPHTYMKAKVVVTE
jgi:amicyanin